jgi:hypothetical protein
MFWINGLKACKISDGSLLLIKDGLRTVHVEQVKPDRKKLLWLKKDVGANVGVSGRPTRRKVSVGNA